MKCLTEIKQDNGIFWLWNYYDKSITELERSKPKYISWPTILGGQILDDKYWPAFKIHDNMRGKDREKFPFIKTAADAHQYLYWHLIDLGMPKWQAKTIFYWVSLVDRKNEFDN